MTLRRPSIDRLADPIVRAAGAALASLEAFAFPQRCPWCGRPASHRELLCGDCRAGVPRAPLDLCVRCLWEGAEPVACGRHPGFQAFVAWLYDERAAMIVGALKYDGRPGLALSLGEAIAAAVPASYRPDLVIEAPLHAVRLRERGYDQAGRLADAVADRLGVPRLRGALTRVRATRPQARLGPEARRWNLADAFRVNAPLALAGRRVLVVDDVVTTGATLHAALSALRSAGAQARGAALAWAQ